MENYDKKHPFKNKWFKARYRAKCRGIIFDISYEDYRDFCIENQIEGKTGRTKECLSIDRIDPSKGYIKGNLQVLTVSENSMKSNKHPLEWVNRNCPDWLKPREDDCPF